jgi:hypothetical protein
LILWYPMIPAQLQRGHCKARSMYSLWHQALHSQAHSWVVTPQFKTLHILLWANWFICALLGQPVVSSVVFLLFDCVRSQPLCFAYRSCSRCHGAITKTTILSSDPDVLQVVVVSPHDNPSASLPSLLEAISASIRLTAVVDVAERVTSSDKHHLRGMVCFTSNHYIALFPTTEGRWVYCDDNTTKLVSAVVRK